MKYAIITAALLFTGCASIPEPIRDFVGESCADEVEEAITLCRHDVSENTAVIVEDGAAALADELSNIIQEAGLPSE